jgi:hypothetical protein
MERNQLKYYIERAYGGSVPDFDDYDWDELHREFEDTYCLFTPMELVAMRRIQKPTEWEMEYRTNFIDRHAPRDENGNISDADWDDAFALADEEMYRLGLTRIAYYQEEMYKRLSDLKEGEVIDNSKYYED